MKCDQSQQSMMDILYGEEADSRRCFEFFRHLADCTNCGDEYLELLGTREMLADWKVDRPEPGSLRPDPPSSSVGQRVSAWGWWTAFQKLAAGFLIIVGITSILQYMGYVGDKRVVVAEEELTQMVHDMMVSQQQEERGLMFQALLRVKEDMELEQQEGMDQVQHYLLSLEQRYVDNLEQNNHYLRTLLSR